MSDRNKTNKVDPQAKELLKSLVKESKENKQFVPAFIEMSNGTFRKNPLLEG
jgi:hypothetical protein